MGVTEALKVQRIIAQACTYNHVPYSVKDVWTVLRYLRKQVKTSKIQRVTRNTQCHKILIRTTSICSTADKLVNCLTEAPANHILH